jgi:chorismate mutase
LENVSRLRKRIDRVDEQILHYISKRTEICRSIGLLKKERRILIKDLPRESDVYAHIREKAAGLGLDPVQVEAIYRKIVNMCTAVQE